MDERVRCPNCGAVNPRTAAWCDQCQRPFALPPAVRDETDNVGRRAVTTYPATPVAETAIIETDVSAGPREAPDEISRGAVEAPDPAPAETAEQPGRPLGEAVRGPFAAGADGVMWMCAACGTKNPIDLPLCSVCGASFKDTVDPEAQMPERDANTTALVALSFPGAGFAYLGRWAEAIGRAVVGAFAIAVALIAGIAGSGSTAATIGGIYSFAAFALWALDVHDAYRVAKHQERAVILKPRVLLYVLLGLLVLFLVILVGSVVGRTSR